MLPITLEQIQQRKSVRTYSGTGIDPVDLEKLQNFMNTIETPYQIPVTFRLLDAKQHDLSSPVINGAELYVSAKVNRIPHGEEAFGFAFEQLVLFAHTLGIGTVWLGGTMDRAAFEAAMDLSPNERMPCVSPLGYPAKKKSLRETMMRKSIQADSRKAFERLFFAGNLSTPLTKQRAGKLRVPLEMVRWAPSAVNRQPWRVIVAENTAHFYKKETKGMVGDAMGDLQKIDLGIALCHFALGAQAEDLNVTFSVRDPKLQLDQKLEYIASYTVTQRKQT